MPSYSKSRTDDERLRRRLAWQCRRGMRELDLLLLAFLHDGYGALGAEQRGAFASLLENPDQLLLAWLMGQERPGDAPTADIVGRIRRSVRGGAALP